MSNNVLPIGKIAEINPRIPRALRAAPETVVSFIPMAAVSEEGYIYAAEKRPARDVLKGYTFFERGDILVAKITPCFENGKSAIANIDTKYGFGTTEFHVIRPNVDIIDPRYLHYFLRTKYVRLAGTQRMTGAGGQRRVPKAFFSELLVPTPRIHEQERIAEILSKVDELRALRRKELDGLDSLMVSLQHRAFSGEL